MELYDVMTTTFASRDFTDEPLPDETLFKILDHARFARAVATASAILGSARTWVTDVFERCRRK